MKIQILGFCVLCLALAGCFDESNVCETSGVSTTTTASGGAGGEGGAGGSGGSGGEGGAIACPIASECDPTIGPPPGGAKQCDDGNPRSADRCIDTHGCGGICAHIDVECDSYDPVSIHKAVCADSLPCTQSACSSYNFCDRSPIPDGTPCNGAGVCMNGACTVPCSHLDSPEVQYIACEDNNPCTTNYCTEIDQCGHDPQPDGVTCPGGTCQSGECK